MQSFTAVYQQRGKWWVGYVEELPGANTQGRTLGQARENLKEAVRLILDTNRELVRKGTKGKRIIREELTLAS
ncbi:MAG: type II toxin-antitoxin system HicB family antitoxin [candidate division NC10 bacterium]|nr:type II toxin-antitoxin system HicB family antitoxin [candidate division NC10 bacterium]MBI2457388.1 type II toxin-antitoxin system HicB family antitoxin [candidate division NC10 bacterium]